MNGPKVRVKRKISKKVIAQFESKYTKFKLKKNIKKGQINENFKKFMVKENTRDYKELKDITDEINFNSIPEIPTITLNEDQTKNFITTLRYLREQYEHFGGVKQILPDQIKPKLQIKKGNSQLFIRQQKLEDLPKGKPFVNIHDAYSFSDFKQVLEEFQDEYEFVNKPVSDTKKAFFERNEKEYWDLVNGKIIPAPNSQDDEFIVEYASDQPVDKFANIKDNPIENPNYKSDNFSLSKVFKLEDSQFQFINNKMEAISGIVIPWCYIGGLFSSFCWHYEDLFLYSVNFMHEGVGKTW